MCSIKRTLLESVFHISDTKSTAKKLVFITTVFLKAIFFFLAFLACRSWSEASFSLVINTALFMTLSMALIVLPFSLLCVGERMLHLLIKQEFRLHALTHLNRLKHRGGTICKSFSSSRSKENNKEECFSADSCGLNCNLILSLEFSFIVLAECREVDVISGNNKPSSFFFLVCFGRWAWPKWVWFLYCVITPVFFKL